MKKKRLLILLLSILMIAALIVVLAACSDKPKDEEADTDDPGRTVKTLTSTQALNKIHSGLLAGGEAVASATQYGVQTEYSIYTSMLNYTVTYKANYNENYADSEIYINLFDNNAHVDRACLYYDGQDLYYLAGENRQVISDFSTTIMYNVFYDMCRKLDATGSFYSDQIGTIFDANSDVNISLILGASNIKYNFAGAEDTEVIELFGLDISAMNENLNLAIQNFFRGIDDKFDLITNKAFGFKLSRIAQTRFLSIYADSLEFRSNNGVTDYQSWTISGSLQDQSKYNMKAVLSYNDGSTRLAESGTFVKSKYTEANVGKNHFVGSVLIPAVSDEEYDADFVTNINSKDNSLNQASLRIFDAVGTDFISGYYMGEHAFVDATGLYNWLDGQKEGMGDGYGAIDLDAFNLPKVYFDKIDLTKLINAGFSDVVKALIVLFNKAQNGQAIDPETYQIVINNLHNDGVSYIYYIFTEEWYHAISGDDTPLMDKVANLIGVDSAQLASYIGEDFFTDSELEVGYDLETKEVVIKLYQHGDMLARMILVRDEYKGVTYPVDVFVGSSAYAKLNLPNVATLEINAELAVRNGKANTDISNFFGAMIGDVTGKNTPIVLNNTEVLIVKGTVTEVGEYQNGGMVFTSMINISVYLRRNSDLKERLALSVCTNPYDERQLLIRYCLPIGDYLNDFEDDSKDDDEKGLCFYLDKTVVLNGFNEILGEENIFAEGSVLKILTTLVTSEGVSAVSNIGGWFSFSLVVSQDADPVYELIGIKDTTASIKARVFFLDVDRDIDVSPYRSPVITPLDSVTVDSIYSDGSAWKDSVQVFLDSADIRMTPTYTEESIKVVTDKSTYVPTAYLLGEEVAYTLTILNREGTYYVDDLVSDVIVLDPAYTDKLPTRIQVVYDNGLKGYLPCEILDFEESNITLAGYNLRGFGPGEWKAEVPSSRVVIGKNSIDSRVFTAYVLVNNRQVVPVTDDNGNAVYDNTGIPVVGVVQVDPYSYAMRKLVDPDYNPVTAAVNKRHDKSEDDMQLVFDGVYGEEEVTDGEDNKTVELKYDVFGVNRFYLYDLDLTWEYDLSRISWRGSNGYAYATYGDDNGNAFRIAIRVIVSAQQVDYVAIDDEVNGTYTIDFLQKETYAIPTQSSSKHTVKVYFVGSNSTDEKFRYVSLSRPGDVSDEEYYDNYLFVSLNWDKAEEINRNPYLITVTRDEVIYTDATFGSGLGIGEQSVSLRVEIPDRTASYLNSSTRVAVKCELDLNGDPVFTKGNVSPSKAYFMPDEHGAYSYGDALEINPYDSSFRLPSTICMEVNSVAGYNPTREVKEYAVTWVTTDNNGVELDLIVEKDRGFALAHPVTYQQDIVVYGKVGDRGDEPNNAQNVGYIWVVMVVCNLRSDLKSITYFAPDGSEGSYDTIYIDPYLEYRLPTGFAAVLASDKQIVRNNIQWYARTVINDETYWYPINYQIGYDPAYYKDGKYVFAYKDDSTDEGSYATAIRYVIEAEEDSIRQEILLNVIVSKRTLVEDRIDIFGNGDQPSRGYVNVNYYETFSETLYQRLKAMEEDPALTSSVAFSEVSSEGTYTMYELAVTWADGAGDYEHSLQRLCDMLTGAEAGAEMTLKGAIYAGTINEQTLSIRFVMIDRVIDTVTVNRIAYGQEKEAIRIGTMDEHTVEPVPFGSKEERAANRTLAFDDVKTGGINIRLDKPYALTIPDENGVERYATPYQYINYVLGSVVANYNGGIDATVKPKLDFVGASLSPNDTEEEKERKRADYFNSSVLIFSGEYSVTTILMNRISDGSARDYITINVYAVKDTRIDNSAELIPELYDTEGKELYSSTSPYRLPTRLTVNYQRSGAVIYDVSAWDIEGDATIRALFGNNVKETSVIGVKLLNTLRIGGDTDKQASQYNFSYTIPCVNEKFYLTINVPKKNVSRTAYNAEGSTDLYDVRGGTLVIDNPYLYYDPDAEFNGEKYGLDVTKIPNVIDPNVGQDYWSTEINSYEIAWTFIKGVFTADKFRDGNVGPDGKGVLFAYADLDAYYDEAGNAQKQRVELYIKINALNFFGISYEELPVTHLEGRTVNDVMVIDPYNDVMGYAGRFTMPTNGLVVSFNGGADSYAFNGVVFKLLDKFGNEYSEDVATITSVDYDEEGHKLAKLGYTNLREDGWLEFNMYIPGFGVYEDKQYKVERDPVHVYLHILSRVVEEVHVDNVAYNAHGESEKDVAGEVVTESLLSLYYIDPYNNATYALPRNVTVKFEGYDDTEEITVAGWAYGRYDETAGKTVYTELPTYGKNNRFYYRESVDDSALKYGYFNPQEEDYAGGIFDLYGYISMGKGVSGNVSKQYFKITVIVLNRSLQMTYRTTYRYDDPFGGILADIGGEINEGMFVNYDNYYEGTLSAGQKKYSEFSAATVPTINWSVNNSDDIIEYSGGFNKEVAGSVYYDNRHRAEEYSADNRKYSALYAELVKARMWDAYFTESGAPLAKYSVATANHLRDLSAELDREVAYETYLILIKEYNSSADETKKQYGSYLTNGLINEITADTDYNRETQMTYIAKELFTRLKDRHDRDVEDNVTSDKGNIYVDWKRVYDAYIAAGTDTDIDLSAYQLLKVAKYDKANDVSSRAFTIEEISSINDPMQARINRNLTPYLRASVWDEMYDHALNNERARMDALIRSNTVGGKSAALTAYLADSVISLGSVGEKVFASVSAPKLTLGNVLDADGNVVSEFLFNIFSKISFLADVDVEVVLNYADIFLPYIEEGLALAYDDYRNTASAVDYSLTEYVARKTAEYVNAIVPMTIVPDSGGQTQPLIDFTYETYEPSSAANATYWRRLYANRLSEYNAFVGRITGATPQDSWNTAYESHRTAGRTDIVAAMDAILAETHDQYDSAFERYCDEILYPEYMGELDSYYDEAMTDVNVILNDLVVNKNLSVILRENGGAYGKYEAAFSVMYSDVSEEILDRLQYSFVGQDNPYRNDNSNIYKNEATMDAVVAAIRNNVSISPTLNDGEVLYHILYVNDTNIGTAIKDRATNIFYWKLGAASAYDDLIADPSSVGYTAEEVQSLMAAATLNVTYAFLNPLVYNVSDGANAGFNEDEFESFAQSALFSRMLSNKANVDQRAIMQRWFDAAIRVKKAAAFDALYRDCNEELRTVLDNKKSEQGLERRAFNYYVAAKKLAGDAIGSAIDEALASGYARAELDAYKNIVNYLIDDGFAYASYLTPDPSDAALYRTEAVEYFRDNFASVKEKAAIDYHLNADGAAAYEALLGRVDLGDAFVRSIENAYYYVVFSHAEIAIKADVRADVSDDIESQGVWTNYESLYRAVAGNGVAMNDEQKEYAIASAIEAYVNNAYASATTYVRTALNSARNAVKNETAKGIYYVYYATDADLLDAILRDYYAELAAGEFTQNSARLKKYAYEHLQKLFIDARLANYYAVADEVVDAVVKSAIYDGLGFYNMSSGELSTAFLADLLDVYADLVADMTTEEKAAFNVFVDDNVFTMTDEDVADAKLLSILTAFEALLDVDAGDAQPNVDALIAGLNGVADDYRAGARDTALAAALTDRVYISTAMSTVKEGAVGFRCAVSIAYTMKGLDDIRRNGGIDPAFLSLDNLAGDFTVTSEEYKRAYVDELLNALFAFTPAYDYLVKAVKDNYIDWYSMNEGDEGYDEMEDKILSKLRLTSLGSHINDETTVAQLVTNVSAEVALWLNPYLSKATGDTDAEYDKVFNAMKADSEVTKVRFYTSDNLSDVDADLIRHEVVFDKSGFASGNNNEILASVSLANGYKGDSVGLTIDGVRYVLASVEPYFVDYYGATKMVDVASYVDGKVTSREYDDNGNVVQRVYDAGKVVYCEQDKNKALVIVDDAYTVQTAVNSLIIDPLAPELPSCVRAYGLYTRAGANAKLYDLGEVTVNYGDVFYENVYEGHAFDATSYVVSLVDSRSHAYNKTVSVAYENRSVSKIYFENVTYGGVRVGTGDYQNYYSVYDDATSTNRITIDPTNEDIIDVDSKVFVLPSQMVVRFADGTEELYRDIVWDTSEVKYLLSAQTGVKLRVISYSVYYSVNGEERERRVSFDYEHNVMTVGVFDSEDNRVGVENRFNNAPAYSIWNVVLDTVDRTVNALYIRNELGETTLLGEMVEQGYIDVEDIVYSLNPFDVVYPTDLSISFNGGAQSDYTVKDWGLEYGATGSFKMADIIIGNALDRYVIATFTKLGYTIRVRFVTDNIKIEVLDVDPVTGEADYIDGGVIYLVAGGGSAADQLATNYSYMYYNFSTSGGEDFRKVALSFANSEINRISTEVENSVDGIKGVLGWDKATYPSLNLSNNIKFNVRVIKPRVSAVLDGDPNPYVTIDYLSAPHDSNYRKVSYAEEDSSGTNVTYFVNYVAGDEDDRRFLIDPSATKYDVLNDVVTFRCLFDLTSSGYRLAADGNGGKEVSFAISVPLRTYLYSDVINAVFETTPVKDANNNDIWTWDDDYEFGDAINWRLGRSMKASELPKASYTVEGVKKEIALAWNLSGVNVNRATEGGEGYLVYAYYYDANGIVNRKELYINVAKIDIGDNVRMAVGGNMAINTEYNGSYYRLPLDLNDENMQVLRADGTVGALNADDVIVEYKLADQNEREYSSTNYPLNAGEYSVRVRINDYNVKLTGEYVFRLNITPFYVRTEQIAFENAVANVVKYVYDGGVKELTVVSGLPIVRVDNWFSSAAEKEALVNEQTAEGYGLTEAKSRAYSALYRKVTPATKRYLNEFVNRVHAETGFIGDWLNATVFDRLPENLEIVEAVYTVKYIQGNTDLSGAPSDAGDYIATFTIDPADNSGNYIFGSVNEQTVATKTVTFLIEKPTVDYFPVSTELTYNGRTQNPYINGLHDADGVLPRGVVITYLYRYTENGEEKSLTGGVVDVGVYTCEVRINGGNNYPSLPNDDDEMPLVFNVTVNKRDLYIGMDEIGSGYLEDIADLNGALIFEGLASGDTTSSLGYADVTTEAKSYYTLGSYPVVINGFRASDAVAAIYTYASGETVVHNGDVYNKLLLRDINDPDSLYRITNTDGSLTYADIIKKFGNYNVYVTTAGEYEIKVASADGATIVVRNGTELAEAIALAAEGDKVTVYLAAATDGEGNVVETDFGDVVVDVEGTVTIYGCYDADRVISTYFDSLRVVNGSVDVRIVRFRADSVGDVGLYVESAAADVFVYNCEFNGNGQSDSVGIRTGDGYDNRLVVEASSFSYYRRALELVGGKLELKESRFVNNYAALTIESNGSDFNVEGNVFAGNEIGVYVGASTVTYYSTIRYNTFKRNSVGVLLRDELGNNEAFSEETLVARNTAPDGSYVFDDSNAIKVITVSEQEL